MTGQPTSDARVFKYKLDFYYQQAVLYLVTLLLYTGVRGTFRLPQMASLASDPILYIILFFVLISLIVLGLNIYRSRKLIVTQDEIIFHQKHRERHISVKEIEWMYIGKERLVQTAGITQIVVFKIKHRRRLFRIRVGRYEHQVELLNEMQRVAEMVPKGKRPFFGFRRPRFVS